MRISRPALAGASLGVLAGILVGLSVSDTVANVLTALVAMIGVVLGLAPLPEESRVRLDPSRIIAFAVSFLVAAASGVLLRTHNILGVSVDQQVEDARKWIGIGVSPELASQIVTGVTPKTVAAAEKSIGGKNGKAGGPSQSFSDPRRRAALGVLSNTTLAESDCADMDPKNIPRMDNRLRTLEARGLSSLAEKIKGAPEAQQRVLYEAAWQIMCKL